MKKGSRDAPQERVRQPTSPKRVPEIKIGAYDAAIFDLDGVLTRTARLHAASWKRLFDDYLRRRSDKTGETFRPFTQEDYRRHVDGLPRYDGVAAFLASRDIELPRGEPSDPAGDETVCGIGNGKNALFQQKLAEDGVEVYDSTVTLILRLRGVGLKTALVSSSRNARPVLEAAGLTGLFDVILDGNDAARLELRGKPAPDIFLAATERLGVAAVRAMMVEDALSGVAAGRAGGFGLVVGVDRAGQRAALENAGADVVVADLGELSVSGPAAPAPMALDAASIARLIGHRRPALFLDYDGTLTPIVARPEMAILSDAVRASIRRLAGLCPVAVVSGRDRADVTKLVALDGLVYAGSHGFDISGPGGLRIEHEKGAAFSTAASKAAELLRMALAHVEGALVEPKRFAVAIHYRQVADADLPTLEAAVDRVLEKVPELRKTPGKKVFELRPRLDWDKGKAVLWLLGALDLEGPEILPIYLGDDTTDEDAFEALAGRGVGIFVGSPRGTTAATWCLAGPAEVGRFLDTLAETLEGRDD
jgi:trehalose 6-phosphate phosphatase